MQEKLIYRHIPIASLFAALGVIFPIFFHIVGLGSAFLPMFLPIMMGSLLLPRTFAISIAIITPLISFLFTGMPPLYPPILPLVLIELLIVSVICSELFFKRRFSVWLTLILALIFDRSILFLFVLLLAPLFGLPEEIFSVGVVLYGIPGIVLILLTIPFVVDFLKGKYPEILNGNNS
jgi:hypothetical protein